MSFCVVGREITERKRAEKELREKDYMVQSALSAIATADLEGNMTYVNPAFLRLWDVDDTCQIYGKPFRTFWEVEERLDEMFHALEHDGKWSDEIKARKRDGTLFHAQVSAAMVQDGSGNPISLMFSPVDLTERKKAEDRFRLAAQVL